MRSAVPRRAAAGRDERPEHRDPGALLLASSAVADRWEAAGRVEANGRVLAVFRPEDVELVESGGVVGKVALASFQGARAMVRVQVGDDLVTVDVPGRDAAALRPGDEVRLLVRSDAVRVFPG